jgi:hypothetical protein
VRSNGDFDVPVDFGDWSGSVDPIDSIPRPTAHLARLLALAARFQLDPDIPFSMRDVPLHPQRDVWQGAAQKEIDMIHQRKVWKLVPRPKDRRVLSSRMVFAHKRNSAGDITKHKARLVVRGYEQQEGTDFNETFAPVAKFQSIRILLALAAQNNWHIHQMDVDSAFLYADLEEELYMEQPEGFVDPGMEDYVCLLLKALYGLKQASRAWYQRMHTVLLEFGFVRSWADHCVYILHRDGETCILFLYVDDNGILSSSFALVVEVKEFLKSRFSMKDLGEAEYILGIQIIRNADRTSITLSQRSYMHTILRRFEMEHCKPVLTPMEPGLRLEPLPAGSQPFDVPYQALIGSLMYLMLATRPDIAFAVSQLSRFAVRPSESHWKAGKHLLRYIQGTLDYGLTYQRSSTPTPLLGYSDADWSNDPSTSRSVGGYAFVLAGGAISWSSALQPLVSLSSTEAEYYRK